jgi:hypothetical protein
MFGNIIGRSAYYPVEATRHYMNIFAVCVGETSKGRKGTSAGHPRRLLEGSEEFWTSERIISGLSSGEGVIWHVRDPMDGQDDEGALDKRLQIIESEFARALQMTQRQGNILSMILRDAWDTGTLRSLVSGRQKSPVYTTGAHVSILAHITLEELRRTFTDTEAGNGFGNRFLWFCVRRAKLLPEGGRYPENELEPLQERTRATIQEAKTITALSRDDAARQRWAEIYEDPSAAEPGLLGALTARSEAQVLRLSCLYALLDQSSMVKVQYRPA